MPQLFSPAESPVWWPVVPVWRSEDCFVLGSVMIAAGHWSASILSTGQTVETDTDLVLELIVLTNTSIT